jgi:6-phosphogluconate dehydrogenase (decarboxylating)
VQEADPTLLEPFVAAAQDLARQGARLISTSCGFLAAHQARLAQAVPVPVITSSLLQCSRYQRPGIVTFDAASLNPSILAAAGVLEGTPVQGIEPGCEMHQRILSNDTVLDLAEAERNVVAAALELVRRHPEVTDIVLECTNMPPYRESVAKATGRRVVDIETLLVGVWGGGRAPRPH